MIQRFLALAIILFICSAFLITQNRSIEALKEGYPLLSDAFGKGMEDRKAGCDVLGIPLIKWGGDILKMELYAFDKFDN